MAEMTKRADEDLDLMWPEDSVYLAAIRLLREIGLDINHVKNFTVDHRGVSVEMYQEDEDGYRFLQSVKSSLWGEDGLFAPSRKTFNNKTVVLQDRVATFELRYIFGQ